MGDTGKRPRTLANAGPELAAARKTKTPGTGIAPIIPPVWKHVALPLFSPAPSASSKQQSFPKDRSFISEMNAATFLKRYISYFLWKNPATGGKTHFQESRQVAAALSPVTVWLTDWHGAHTPKNGNELL